MNITLHSLLYSHGVSTTTAFYFLEERCLATRENYKNIDGYSAIEKELSWPITFYWC